MSKFKWGRTSRLRLTQAHPDLVRVVNRALSYDIMDITIVCTYRGRIAQNKAYYNCTSKLKFPESKHNVSPSLAIDVVPYIDGESCWEKEQCYYMSGIIKAAAKEEGVSIMWGGDWDGNGNVLDGSFRDLLHFEIVESS